MAKDSEIEPIYLQMFQFFDSDSGKELLGMFGASLNQRDDESFSDQFDAKLRSLLRSSKTKVEVSKAIESQFVFRRRYERKIGRFDLFLTERSAQQGSSFQTVLFKCDLLKEKSLDQRKVLVLDLCCGAGFDSVGFSENFPTIAIDRDRTLVEFTNRNLKQVNSKHPAVAFCMDVEDWIPAKPVETAADLLPQLPANVADWLLENQLVDHQVVWHLDPDRRSQGVRFTSMDQFSPSMEVIESFKERFSSGILKLAPATKIPESWQTCAQWIWIGHDRECKQLLGVFGEPFHAGRKGVSIWNPAALEWKSWVASKERQSYATNEIPVAGDVLLEPHSCVFAGRLSKQISPSLKILGSEGNYLFCKEGDWLDFVIGQQYWKSQRHCRLFRIIEVLPPKEKRIRQFLQKEGLVLTHAKKRNVSTELYDRIQKEASPTAQSEDENGCVALFFVVNKKIRVAICKEIRPV